MLYHCISDGAKLEYIYMQFSHSEYLITITGVPEYKLIVWYVCIVTVEILVVLTYSEFFSDK